MRRIVIALGLVLAGASASAESRRLAVETPVEAFTAPPATASLPVSRVIYLERCVGGCLVHGGTKNDASSLTSTIPNPGNYSISEFENAASENGVAADAEWAQVVQCVREVYSPFDVEVTDVKPTEGTYHLALVAGDPQQIGLENNVLGVAPLASNCAAFDNVMSFSFANAHMQTDTTGHVNNVCWTVAQESAHAFGLDHEYEFSNGGSACKDPMTYRTDCGGQKFFRDQFAKCGREHLEDCRCTSTQNSHRVLEQLFGPGTPAYPAPELVMTMPSLGATELPGTAMAHASSKRGVAKLSFFMNGFPMVDIPGAPFGVVGQADSDYQMVVPPTMPNSIYDVFVRACDDLGLCTDSPTVTVTKGAACTSADACLAFQKCEQGRCFWDAPVGEIGDACEYSQFCKSNLCTGTADQQICTTKCDSADPDACPSGMDCFTGVCFYVEGGCCSASPGGWMPAGLLGFLVMVGILRRKRT